MVKATGVHKIHSTFSASGGVLSFTRDNASTQFAYGEDGTGLDVKFFGDTSGKYALWDESADTFDFNCTLTVSGNVTLGDGITLATSTGSGTIIATSSLQKLGFWGATATLQQASISAATCSTSPSVAIAAVVTALTNIGILK
jgi:hypothetical protein